MRRWFGKPVTGYHVCLVTLILLFLHVPQLYGGSWEREADLLAIFFLLTATWDFLWFACNRFGVRRFHKGQIWWFPLTVVVTAATLRPHRRASTRGVQDMAKVKPG